MKGEVSQCDSLDLQLQNQSQLLGCGFAGLFRVEKSTSGIRLSSLIQLALPYLGLQLEY